MKSTVLATITALFMSAASVGETIYTQCPATFDTLPVYADARFCQTFEATDMKPGKSMTYHVDDSPEQIIDYYQQQSLAVHSTFNNHTLLTNEQLNLRVVVSNDNQGSQVDILIL